MPVDGTGAKHAMSYESRLLIFAAAFTGGAEGYFAMSPPAAHSAAVSQPWSGWNRGRALDLLQDKTLRLLLGDRDSR